MIREYIYESVGAFYIEFGGADDGIMALISLRATSHDKLNMYDQNNLMSMRG